jgi:CspA family cold shock protein
MPTGTIKFFNRKKGFGFIRYDESEREIFVHATNMADKRTIQENDKVSFEEMDGERGPTAVNVKKI